MKNLLLISTCLLLWASCSKKADFDKNLRESYRYAVLTATSSQMVIGTTASVWHNAIYEHEDSHGNYVSDFNEALQRLYKEYSSNGIMDSVLYYKTMMDSLASELTNPPSDKKDEYDDYIKLVSEVNTLYRMAKSPEGSLTNFSSNAQQQAIIVSKLNDEFRLKYSATLKEEKTTK